MGELCFLCFLVVLAYFLWTNQKEKHKKRSFLEPGVTLVLSVLKDKYIFRWKSGRVKRLQKIYVGLSEEEIYYKHYGKIGRQIGGVLLAGLFLASMAVFIREESKLADGYYLERDEVDGKEREFTIQADSGKEKKKLAIRVPGRSYSEKEQKEVLQEVKQKIEDGFLGENPSADKVTKPLVLNTSFKGYAVSIRWGTEKEGLVRPNGTLNNQKLKEPKQTEIKAILFCGKTEEQWTHSVIIYPVLKKTKLSFWDKWKKVFKKNEKETKTESYVKLPEKVEGREMQYQEDKFPYSYAILLGVLILCSILPVLAESRMRDQMQKRQDQLSMDYPEFIEQFVLLLGAGLTVKGTWERMVEQYQKTVDRRGQRFVYEEMAVTIREMENGLNEAKAYEVFGKRMELLPYMKFCTLIVQNLQKGSADLLSLLEYEMLDSFHARKDNARKLGEKAGTKLLMPMALMLLIVFALIMYAAFQNM